LCSVQCITCLLLILCLFGCICYLYCINAASGWTTHLQFSDNNNTHGPLPSHLPRTHTRTHANGQDRLIPHIMSKAESFNYCVTCTKSSTDFDKEEWRLLGCYAVSEELSASFIRVTRIGELGTTLALTSNRRTLRINTCDRDEGGAKFLRNVGSYKSHKV
jgi:hypothetical protein